MNYTSIKISSSNLNLQDCYNFVQDASCGGCFNKIPPQRELDIVTKKKIIICEHCGRILIPTEVQEEA